MKDLADICKRVIYLPKIADKLFIAAVKENEAYIRTLNLYQLYEQGVNTDAEIIGYYSPVSIYLKGVAANYGRDSKTDHITLKDTGAFYDSFKVVIQKTQFKIIADDNKDGNHLQDAYPKIIGLTEESMGKLKERMLPIIIEDLRTEILG